MKKLLLTAAISGLMMSGGAFADKTYTVWGCPQPAEIVQQQLIHKKETFTYKDKSLNLIYEVNHNNSTPPKQITEIQAGPGMSAPHNRFQMKCVYDNGIVAKLNMTDCKDSYKE